MSLLTLAGASILVLCIIALSVWRRSSQPAPTRGARGITKPHLAQTRTPIKHVIFIVKENRTFDNYFARYPGADGTTTGVTSTGQTVPLSIAADVLKPDLGHDFLAGVVAVDGGRMDAFDRVSNGQSLAGYSSFTRQGIPNYWAYADHFALSDRMFSSVYGPTFPNHLFTVAAQAGRVTQNKLTIAKPGVGYCDDPAERTYRFIHLDPAQRTKVMMAEHAGDVTSIRALWEKVTPCFDFRVLPDELNKKHLSWRYYDENGSWFNALLAIRHMRYSKYWAPNVQPRSRFVPDLKGGSLPDVTWVIPPTGYNDHPGGPSVCMGENWAVRTINAMMNSPYWKNTVI
ncbi:MAG: hypothetical protein M3P18_12815, partial [Actinomycetota bacterium]|nr:hypothetical protein [Actinomycetota bacterium]